jgi:uncharacterized phiE125 gp8 family phage protein
MTFKVITPPTAEPITIEEARLDLRVTPDDGSPPFHPDDTLIMSLVSAAREYCEQYVRRALAPQTVEVVLDDFPDNEIQLPMSPIASITSIKYIDGDGNQQTLSSGLYVLDNDQEPGWVLPLLNTEWPATYEVVNAVRVRYEVGYTSAQDSPNNRPLPAAIRAAMLLLVCNWYENREAVVIGTIRSTLSFAVDALLLPYRLRLSLS